MDKRKVLIGGLAILAVVVVLFVAQRAYAARAGALATSLGGGGRPTG